MSEAAQQPTLDAAVQAAWRQGWTWEDGGPGWARMGRWEPVNHGALAVFSLVTLGLGLFVWAYVASQGPQWRRMVLSVDEAGRVTATHLDSKGRPTRAVAL